jgi:hypothetical protein
MTLVWETWQGWKFNLLRALMLLVTSPGPAPLRCIPLPLFFSVLGFELRAYLLSHSISPIFVKGLTNYLLRLALNLDSPE